MGFLPPPACVNAEKLRVFPQSACASAKERRAFSVTTLASSRGSMIPSTFSHLTSLGIMIVHGHCLSDADVLKPAHSPGYRYPSGPQRSYVEEIWATLTRLSMGFSVWNHLSDLDSCTFLELVYHFDGVVAGEWWGNKLLDTVLLGTSALGPCPLMIGQIVHCNARGSTEIPCCGMYGPFGN